MNTVGFKNHTLKENEKEKRKGKTFFEIILSTGGSCCSVNTEHLS